MKSTRYRWFVALAPLLVGCAASMPPQRRIETVTSAGGGRFWAAGSNGMAVYYDGDDYQTRDYPLNPKIDRELYDPDTSFPVAKVVIVGGDPILFTRVGDVFRWHGPNWERIAIAWPSAGSTPQIDRVFVASDDSLWIQIHSEVIVHGSLDDFRAGRFAAKRTPSYFVQLDRVEDHFVAVGYASDGNTLIGFEQTRTGWRSLGKIGREGLQADRGVIVLSDGSPVAVFAAGLIPLVREQPLGELARFLPVHGFNLEHTPYAADNRPQVARVFSGDKGRALVTWTAYSGDAPAFDVVELREDRAFAWRCDPNIARSAVGAFPLEGGWRIVETELGIADLPSSRCKPARPALIRAR